MARNAVIDSPDEVILMPGQCVMLCKAGMAKKKDLDGI